MRPPEKTRRSTRLGALLQPSLGSTAPALTWGGCKSEEKVKCQGTEGADTITRPRGPWDPQALQLSFTEGSALSRGHGCSGAAQGPPEDGA